MNLPLIVPDWLPWWVPVLLLIPILLYILAFLFMPFSVIGLKGRLDVLEAHLDELHQEIRHLALRLPDAGRHVDFDELYAPEPIPEPPRKRPVVRPPIPPAPPELEREQAEEPEQAAPAPRPRREPRLDWPR